MNQRKNFTFERFRELRGTVEFKKWFQELRELGGSERDRALEDIGPHIIMTAYMHPDGLIVKPGRSSFSHLATNRGFVHDYAKQYWTEGEIAALGMECPLKRYGMFGPLEDQPVFFALWLCHVASMGSTKFQKVLFLNDASGAVDTSVLLAWDLQHCRAILEKRNPPEVILCPEDSFFGSGLIGRRLSRVNGFEYARDIPIGVQESIKRVLLPSPKGNPNTWFSLPSLNDIAVFISEIVQGVGGDVDLSAGLLRMQEDLRKAGVFIIIDEASTAPGKMGSFFALPKLNLYADMLICGKGIAGGEICGAIIFSESLSDLIDSPVHDGHHFLVGRTMAGGSYTCSKALDFHLNLDESGVIDRVNQVSKKWHDILAPLKDEFSDLIVSFRGKGTHYSFEFKSSRIPNMLRWRLLEDGVLVDVEARVLPLRFNPDFNSPDEVRHMASSMRMALLEIRNRKIADSGLPSAVFSHFRMDCIRCFHSPEFTKSLLGLVHEYCDALHEYDNLEALEPPFGIRDWTRADACAQAGNVAGAMGLLRGEFVFLFINGELKGMLNFEVSGNEAIELHAIVNKGLRRGRYGTKLYERFIAIAQSREGVDRVVFYNLPLPAETAVRDALPESMTITEEEAAEGKKFMIRLN
jgi:acetylornithine/succinyldiaminopimelate/putrescine aminotransferase